MLEMESHLSRFLTLLREGHEVVQGIHLKAIRGAFCSDGIITDNKLTANTPARTFVFWTVGVNGSTWKNTWLRVRGTPICFSVRAGRA